VKEEATIDGHDDSRHDPAGIAAALFDFRLRPTQQQAIDAAVAGHDVVAVLPTGSGKSAIYQVAGPSIGGLTLVISPLIALQRDQARALAGRRLHDRPVGAAMLNSAQTATERNKTVAQLGRGELDFLILGPEQLSNPETRAAVREGPRQVGLFVVDEAHLVTEWGQEFRPEYVRLVDAVAGFGRPVVLALTATASPPVQADIIRRLGMTAPTVVVADFDRPNISLAMRRTRPAQPEPQAIEDACVDTLMVADTPALVYALTHAQCESIAARLRMVSLRAATYHGGMPAATRAQTQDAFFSGKLDIVVATSAFGMGIDKPDIRLVVHAGVPASLDDYYQEIGRAGRDGMPARAVLIHDPRTIRIPRLLAARAHLGAERLHRIVEAVETMDETSPATELARAAKMQQHVVDRVVNELVEMGFLNVTGSGRSRVVELKRQLPTPPCLAEQLLNLDKRRQAVLTSRIAAAREYAETTRCRRAELLAYFGEDYQSPCGNCDNDETPAPSHHATSSVGGGIAVHHRLWGDGLLLSRDDHELLIYFAAVGYKHLIASALTSGILQTTAAG
jgi:ATP-dependent DNA helicase RecQ